MRTKLLMPRFFSVVFACSMAVAVVLSFAACGEIVDTPTSTSVTSAPASTGGGDTGVATLVATSGARLERRVSGPGRLEFDVTGMYAPNTELKQHIAWGYEPGQSFTGGRGGNGAEWGLRTYKMKVFEVRGHYISEPRYNIAWDKSKTYHVIIEWGAGSVSADVGGSRVSVGATYPSDWIVGIGWPPAVRPGVEGAAFSNIVWPAGSTEL